MAWCKTNPCTLALSEFSGQDPAKSSRGGITVAGDIIKVSASLSLPIHKAIVVAKISDFSAASKQQVERMENQQTQVSGKQKVTPRERPAIVVEVTSPTKVSVCLMGTFKGNNFTEFPALIKHFLVPVFPNTAHISEHLHTLPQWEGNGNQQWVLAFPFLLKNQPIDCRWQHNGGSARESGHYFAGKDTVDKFNVFCQDRVRDWTKKSTPLKRVYAREYMVRHAFLKY